MSGERENIEQKLDQLFSHHARSDRPGFVIGVAKDGETLYRKGFGLASLEHSVANTPATRMRIGSTSKHFTCLAAFLLAEQGKLGIDDSVRNYLPELPVLQGEPTLRQLMSHTGGYRCHLDVSFIADGMAIKPRGEGLKTELRQTDVNFGPGDKMIYCNGGYHLLTIIIEKVAGLPFEQFMQENIFDPLGMIDTRSVPSDFEIHERVATLHVPLPDGTYRRGIFPTEEIRGEGAIISTIDDMLVWLAHLRGEKKLGSEDSWQQITTRTRLNDGEEIEYCLGLVRNDYRGIEVIHHGGGVIGGTCQMITAPQHALDIIVIANGMAARPADLAHQVIDTLLGDELLGPRADGLATQGNEYLSGRYIAQKSGLIFDIADAGGVLGLGVIANAPAPLTRVGDHLELQFSTSAMGPYRIMLPGSGDQPVNRLAFYDCGETDTLVRLTDEPPEVVDMAARTTGSYYCADIDAPARIVFENDELTLVIDGHFGGNRLRLEPLSLEICAATIYISTQPSVCTLHLEAKGDQVNSFELNTMRTRHLRFDRRA